VRWDGGLRLPGQSGSAIVARRRFPLRRFILIERGRLHVVRYNDGGLYALRRLRGPREAKRFLKQFMYRPAAMLRLRELLGELGLYPIPGKAKVELNKLTALELLDQAARHIAEERVIVGERLDRTNAPSVFDDRKEETVEAAPAAPPPKVAPPPPEPPPPPDVVAETQAQVLVEAARDGIPFCEECAKLAAQTKARADAAQLAQAQVLVLAAKDGIPFCEECEKAKQAEAAAA
jgi:hypothetical protein